MKIGYMRVSKNDGSQKFALQKDALLVDGVEENRIYQDMASGRKDKRLGLESCLKALQPDNTLVVWKLDRLGRDLKHLVTLVDDLNKRGVGLKVLAGAGAQIDTSTANGKLVFGIFAALAEFERELISERTIAGLAAARARGKLGGRPRKMDKDTLMIAIKSLEDKSITVQSVAKRLNMTTTTLYEYLNGDGSLKEPGYNLLNGNA
jgi:DNA invertase Pin-like site-specific DNA recombinase